MSEEPLNFRDARGRVVRGGRIAEKHGVYTSRFTPEEEKERAEFENDLLTDLGGYPTTAQRTLIRRASYIEIRLRRTERATEDGWRLPSEHVLAWVNSQRLLLCALGLERRTKPAPSLQDYVRRKEWETEDKQCGN